MASDLSVTARPRALCVRESLRLVPGAICRRLTSACPGLYLALPFSQELVCGRWQNLTMSVCVCQYVSVSPKLPACRHCGNWVRLPNTAMLTMLLLLLFSSLPHHFLFPIALAIFCFCSFVLCWWALCPRPLIGTLSKRTLMHD